MATIKARRRPTRDGVERSNDRFRISPIPSAHGETFVPRQSAWEKDGPGRRACRWPGENSNASIVRSDDGSGFIAAIRPATIEIFSAEIRRWRVKTPVRPLPRRKPKSPLEAPGVIRPYLGVDDARRPLAIERVQKLLGGDPAHVLPRFPGHAGRMRACEHVVELQQRMIRRRRLLGPYVEAGACDRLSRSASSSAASSWIKPRAVVMK